MFSKKEKLRIKPVKTINKKIKISKHPYNGQDNFSFVSDTIKGTTAFAYDTTQTCRALEF